MTIYLTAMLHGILTFISPCILPLIPVFIFFLAGNKSPEQKSVRLIINTAAYILGFSAAFTLLGTAATVIGGFLNDNLAVFRKISGIAMILIGLNFLGVIKIGILNRNRALEPSKKDARFFTSFIFGITFAFAWSPCLTAFLGNILILASNRNTVLEGSILLLTFSLGLGIPFLLTALLYGKLDAAFGFIKRNFGIIRIISGILMIASGILVFFDYIKYLSF